MTGPARKEETIPAAALIVSKVATAAIGNSNRWLAYSNKKGQIMLVPMRLTSSPANINQNWAG
jgi:hypothetical protein